MDKRSLEEELSFYKRLAIVLAIIAFVLFYLEIKSFPEGKVCFGECLDLPTYEDREDTTTILKTNYFKCPEDDYTCSDDGNICIYNQEKQRIDKLEYCFEQYFSDDKENQNERRT